MDKIIYLSLAIHGHQPLGNFPFVFAEAYEKAYLPLSELLERHPQIKISLHYSGPLRDWLAQEHPEFLKRIAALVARGQVEIMTAGYYEPILVSIPEEDRIGQITKLSRQIEIDFGYRPVGAWLTERVWEPSLPKTLARANVKYVVVDDHHFRGAGLEGEIQGYYITEDEGYPLKIFASSQHLRYTLPWHDVEEVVEWLKSQTRPAEGVPPIAVMGDDGEKFGLWPGTYQFVWEEGWMERFFQKLQESNTIQTITLAEYASQYPAAGRIYLPTASYVEMTEWALPAELSYRAEELRHRWQEEGKEDLLIFLRGGHWRNFLAKYPEVNDLHKKMLLVHEKIKGLPPSPTRDEAQDMLWKAQGNDPYWHGSFGGIYLPHLRHAASQHLIRAENLADRIRYPQGDWLEYQVTDFRRDSHQQILVSGSQVNVYFALAEGGSLFRWDFRKKAFDLLNTLTRRPEGYHQKIRAQLTRQQQEPAEENRPKTIHELVAIKEKGLESLLVYDTYRRGAFLDHFLSPTTTLPDFEAGDYPEEGDFINRPYQFVVKDGEDSLTITLFRDGQVRGFPIRLEKSFQIKKGSPELTVTYHLTNRGNEPLSLRFGVEVNFGLLSGHAPDAFYHIPGATLEDTHLDSKGEIAKAEQVSLVNRYLNLEIICQLQPAAKLWRLPIFTVSSSESGFEKVYQASCLVFIWDVIPSPDQAWKANLLFQLI